MTLDPHAYLEQYGDDASGLEQYKSLFDSKMGDVVGIFQPDSGHDAIRNLAEEMNLKLDASTKDYLYQYYLQEQSSQNAWKREMDASNTQYQRAVEDLKKAGINPFLAISSLSGSSSPSSSGQGLTGGLLTSKSNNKNTTKTTMLGILGLIAAAIIKAVS